MRSSEHRRSYDDDAPATFFGTTQVQMGPDTGTEMKIRSDTDPPVNPFAVPPSMPGEPTNFLPPPPPPASAPISAGAALRALRASDQPSSAPSSMLDILKAAAAVPSSAGDLSASAPPTPAPARPEQTERAAARANSFGRQSARVSSAADDLGVASRPASISYSTAAATHPAGLPPAPSGRLDIPPGAYVYTGPPLPPNALGRAEWLADETVPNCMRCGEEFNFTLRRHHCRQCGQIFCYRCCNSKALLQPDSGTPREHRIQAHWFFGETETDPLKPQKVCGKCFDLLLPMQPYLTATVAKAVQAPDFSAPTIAEWGLKPISRSFKLEIKKAVHNLDSFLGMPDDGMVRRLLDNAYGIMLLTIVKVSFLGGMMGGGGLVLARDPESGQWSAPCCVGVAGFSVGAQLGAELNTVLLILNTQEAVNSFMGSASLTLGAHISVAAGPIGRAIEGTGVVGETGAQAACYSYAFSRGLYAGVGLDGTCVFTRDRLNHTFYGHPASARQLLSGRIAPPRAAEPLYRALRTHTSGYVP